MVDEIRANGIVPAGHESDLQLRADAVGARHEHRLATRIAIELEQSTERSNLGEDPGRERRTRERFDPADGLVSGIDIYA